MTGLLVAGGACLAAFVATFWIDTLLNARRTHRDEPFAAARNVTGRLPR